MTNDVFSQISDDLALHGYSVQPSFFSAKFCTEVLAEIEKLRTQGGLRPAAVGRADHRRPNSEIRGDGTSWFEPEDPDSMTPVQSEISAALEGLRTVLNENLFLGLWDWEGHYAWYAPGTFYREHLDRFRDESRRTVSVVFFFNPEWQPADEGCLRLALPEGECRIEPRAGTAVIFLSDRISHEVLPTKVDRYSFAGWLRTRSG